VEVVVVYMLGVELYLKMEFGPWDSINPSRQFLEFISCNCNGSTRLYEIK
jgi:hypothetical protein